MTVKHLAVGVLLLLSGCQTSVDTAVECKRTCESAGLVVERLTPAIFYGVYCYCARND